MELIHILERTLYGNSFRFPFKIHRLMDSLFLLIQILYISNNAIRFMKLNMFRCPVPFILKNNHQIRVQVSRLMQPALHLCRCKPGLFKNLRIRQKVNPGSRLFRPSDDRKQPIF